jgi:glycosyltransferase involved in cell wall biosynthesis
MRDPVARVVTTPGRPVLVVGKGFPDRGGIPSFLAMLLSSAELERYRPTLLNLARSGDRQGGRLSGSNLVRTAVDAIRVWRAARGCSIVHIHSALAPAVTVLRAGALAGAARLRGKPVLLHAHGGLVQLWLTTRVRRAVVRLALWPAQRVVAVSTDGCRALQATIGADRVLYLANGVDVDRFIPTEHGHHHPPRVLYVGLLTPRKGVVDLLEASKLLIDRGVEHEVLLVGGTPDEGGDAEQRVRSAMGTAARSLGIRDIDEMPGVYADADIFCLPSWWEATPLSVLEAMASGLPVLATRVGDVPRLVLDDVTGLLVQPRSPAQLADALQRLLESPELRAAMGAAGRDRAEQHFSAATATAAIASLYDTLARSRS